METNQNNMLKTFIRNDQGIPEGVAVVIKDEHGVCRYGYSLTNTKHDRFNKVMGTKIAVNRATEEFESLDVALPDVMKRRVRVCRAYSSLQDRAKKYFK